MNHGLSRARLRGIQKIHEQCLLIAVVQNIKKMIKHIIKKEPVAEMAQALSVNYGSFVPVIVF
jgi:hypothetical protein